MNFIFISPNFPSIYSHFVKELNSLGVNVLGIGDQPYDFLNEELKQNLTEYCYVSNMNIYEWMRNTVEYLKNKYGEIDYIESNNEYWMKQDAKLREEFNVKNGYKIKDLEELQSKSKMKKYFEKAGLKTARYIISSSLEESLKFVNEVGYPVFAKPDSGVGAASTFKISNEQDLINFHNLDHFDTYIIEEFLDGYIVSFDGIANKESDVVISYKETFPTPIAEVVEKNEDVYYYAQTKISKDYYEMGKRIVKAFNISSRCFHIELFVLNKNKNGLGKKGDIIALEVNLRSPGGETPELLNQVSKNDYYKTYAEMIVNNIGNLNNKTKFLAASVNRKNNFHYAHEHGDILNHFSDSIVKTGNYSDSFRNALGDSYYIAKFDTKKKMDEFISYVLHKNNIINKN